jgi:hypothetical protein
VGRSVAPGPARWAWRRSGIERGVRASPSNSSAASRVRCAVSRVCPLQSRKPTARSRGLRSATCRTAGRGLRRPHLVLFPDAALPVPVEVELSVNGRPAARADLSRVGALPDRQRVVSPLPVPPHVACGFVESCPEEACRSPTRHEPTRSHERAGDDPAAGHDLVAAGAALGERLLAAGDAAALRVGVRQRRAAERADVGDERGDVGLCELP